MFIGLSVSLQTLKVYLDYLLRWSSTLNPWFNFIQTLRDLVGSPSAGDVSSFFHIFGSLSFVVILVTYFYNILGQVCSWKILLYFKIVVAVLNIPYFQWIGANARENLHEKMLRNLFLCPIELFESYPIGRSFMSPLWLWKKEKFIFNIEQEDQDPEPVVLWYVCDRPKAALLPPSELKTFLSSRVCASTKLESTNNC